MAIIARDPLGYTEVSLSHGSSFESLVVRPSSTELPLIIVVYRPPSSPVTQFFTDFSTLLTQVLLGKRPILLAGDFNIHVDDISDPTARSFLDLLSAFGLSQHVHEPTHRSGHTLDLLVAHEVVPDDISVSPLTLSDHSSVSFLLPIAPKQPPSCTLLKHRALQAMISRNS